MYIYVYIEIFSFSSILYLASPRVFNKRHNAIDTVAQARTCFISPAVAFTRQHENVLRSSHVISTPRWIRLATNKNAN